MYFDYLKPKTVAEITGMLDRYGDSCEVIAGGTDLIPKMKSGIIKPEYLINLEEIRELKGAEYDHKKGLRIGAMATLRELEAMPEVREHYPALYEGMHSMASTQIRNTATVAGNICNAVPSADTAPALIALDAKVTIVSTAGQRTVDMEDFFTGVCKTLLQKNELVTEICLPPQPEESSSTYIKYTVRKALELPMVGVAVNLKREGGKCEAVRIGLGAVAATPKRADSAEQFLQGKELTEETIRKAAELAGTQDCTPISDMRATAEYRREMVKVCTKDALMNLIGEK